MYLRSRPVFASSFSFVFSAVVGISCTAPMEDKVDASVPTDSGSQVDASVPTDSGSQVDASVPTDSGSQVDASVPTDSGSQVDASGPTDSGSQVDASVPTDSGERCAAMLVSSQTGSSSTCAGGSVHVWPIGLAPTDCHGWRSLDNVGDEHDNSANQIRCNSDGSVSFVQYAGSIDCTEILGPGVAKTFRNGDCEQDIPPSLYTTGLDTTCCTNPNAAGCMTGSPSALNGEATIYLNGALCED